MALLVLKALIAAGNSFAQKVQKEQWCLYHLIFDLVCLESFCIQSSFRVTAVVQMSLEFRTQLCKVSLWIRKRGADVHLADVQCCPKCKNSKHVSIVLSPPSLSSLSSSLLISSFPFPFSISSSPPLCSPPPHLFSFLAFPSSLLHSLSFFPFPSFPSLSFSFSFPTISPIYYPRAREVKVEEVKLQGQHELWETLSQSPLHASIKR